MTTETVIFTAIGSVLGFFGRSLWGAYVKRREDMEKTARTKRLAFLERQLSEFYWPIKIRLEKDNVVWAHMLAAQQDDAEKKKIALELEASFILPNHAAVLEIVEKNMHLAGSDAKPLVDKLLEYIRHVAVYQAVASTRVEGAPHRFPKDYELPYPVGLFELVAQRTELLQSKYDKLLGRSSEEAS